MSMSEVGSGQVAIVPTFKGFRKAVNAEADGAAKESSRGFRRLWSKEGTSSGREVGAGFKKAFEASSSGFSEKARKAVEQDVAKAARALSKARLTEQDATGKARVAERQLAEAREKYARDSSRVVAAEEKLEAANRRVKEAQDDTRTSSQQLKDAQAKLASAAESAAGRMDEAGRSGARKFESGFKGVFSGSFLGTTVANLATSLVSRIGTAIGTGLRNAVDFAMGSLGVSSDVNESINAVKVAFGDVGDEVLSLGRDSAKQFGLSQGEFNSYAVQMSAFAQQIAGDGGDVVGTLDDIVSRATDFASVMNLDVGDSLGLIQSGLAGETEPLRKYGIDLSAAAVEAYAAANGIGTAGEELTEQQKVLARFGSLMEQTSKVQGDFANTSGSFANKQRIVASRWEDIRASMGEKFMPVAEKVLDLVDRKLLPMADKLIDKFGPQIAQAFEDALPGLIDSAEKLLPLLPGVLQSMADNLPSILGALSESAPTITDLLQVVGDFFDATRWAWELLSGGMDGDEYAQSWLEAQGPVADWVGSVMFNLARVITFFQSLPDRIKEAIEGIGEWLVDSGKALIKGFMKGINEQIPWLDDAVRGALDFVAGFFPNSPAKRGPFSGSGWTKLSQGGGAVFEEFAGGIEGAQRAIDLTYPTMPGAGAAPGSGAPVSGGFTQINNFDHMDPKIAVVAAGQQFMAAARKAR